MATIVDLNQRNLNLAKYDKVIFDTNIWLYLFGYYNESDHNYSNILEKLISNAHEIIIPSVVISEYINVCCRLAFKSYCEDYPKSDFKRDFRPTSKYRIAYSLATSSVVEDMFNFGNAKVVDIDNEVIELSVKNAVIDDFNDTLILNLASQIDAAIITHDIDFQNHNSKTPILTLNIKK